jgi:hypothetical protein
MYARVFQTIVQSWYVKGVTTAQLQRRFASGYAVMSCGVWYSYSLSWGSVVDAPSVKVSLFVHLFLNVCVNI